MIPEVTQRILQAKASAGVTFASLAKSLGCSPVFLAAVCYRQASATREQAEALLDALGLEGDEYRAQVRWLWEGHYRVNLLTGEGPTTTRIAASHFLVVGSDGSILASTPGFARLD